MESRCTWCEWVWPIRWRSWRNQPMRRPRNELLCRVGTVAVKLVIDNRNSLFSPEKWLKLTHHISHLTLQKIVQHIFTDDLCTECTTHFCFFSHKERMDIEFWFFDRQIQEADDGVWFGSHPGRSAGGREGHSTPSAGTGSGAGSLSFFILLSQLAQAQVRGHCHSLLFWVSWQRLRCGVIAILYSFESASTGSGAGSLPFFTLLSQLAQAQVRGHCHSFLFWVS